MAEEASAYGSAPTLLATHAVRHLPGTLLSFNPRNPAKSPARYAHLSQMDVFTRRQVGSWTVKSMLHPSGTLNTLPELDALLAHAFGAAATNITLSTTFSGTPTTTGGTVASAAGLAIGQFVQITTVANSAGVYIRKLTGVSGANLTWTPALPGAPSSGEALKGCVTYTPATATPKSLDIAHYPQAPAASTPAREMLGCMVDKTTFEFDANTEPMATFSGMAQGLAGTSPAFTPQSQPGGFTTVGADSLVPSGLTGYFYVGGTLYQVEKVQIDVTWNRDVQNTALGTSKATAAYTKGKREVAVKIDAKVSDDTTLWTPSLSTGKTELFLQLGTTGTQLWAVYMPNVVIMKAADIKDSGDSTEQWNFEGTALGASGNDELLLAAA